MAKTIKVVTPDNLSDVYFDKGVNTPNKIEYKFQYSIASLKTATNTPPIVFITDNTKEGLFEYDSTDTITVSDDTDVIVTNAGRRYKRRTSTTTEILNKLDKGYTINQLRTLSDSKVNTIGLFYCIDSGKEGWWKYDSTDTSSIDNLGTILVTSTGKRLKRIVENYIYPEWFGAIGDGITDDTSPIQNSLNILTHPVYLSSKTYIITGITLKTNNSIVGENIYKSVLKLKSNSTSTTSIITLFNQYQYRISLNNFTIDGNRANQTTLCTALNLNNPFVDELGNNAYEPKNRITNLYITEVRGDGIYVSGSGDNIYDNIIVQEVLNNGLVVNCWDSIFSNITLGHCYNGSALKIINDGGGTSNRFSNIKCWGSNNGVYILGQYNNFSVLNIQDCYLWGLKVNNRNNTFNGLDVDAIGWDFTTSSPVPNTTAIILESNANNTIIKGRVYDRAQYSITGSVYYAISCVANNVVTDLVCTDVLTAPVLNPESIPNTSRIRVNGNYRGAGNFKFIYPNDETLNLKFSGFKSANYTATNQDNVIYANTSSSNVTITLPVSNIENGKIFTVSKSSSSNTAIINIESGGTINGNTSYTINSVQESVSFIKVGATSYGILSSFNNNIFFGNGSPEGSKFGEIGNLFLRLNGTSGDVGYLKETASSNTGWKSIITNGQTKNLLLNTSTDDGTNKLQVNGGVSTGNITSTGTATLANRLAIIGDYTSSNTGGTGVTIQINDRTVNNSNLAANTINSFQTHVGIGGITFSATNTNITHTIASSLYIKSAPIAGTNVTITNPFAMYVASGKSYIGDNLLLGNNVDSGDKLQVNGSTLLTGNIKVSSGTNKNTDSFTLVGGTLTIVNSLATTASKIFLTRTTSGGTIGNITVTKANGSFTVTSSSNTETSTFDYLIIN